MNSPSRLGHSLSANARVEPRRRKVRKGTQSCWECKRRKVRCNFVATTDLICDGCKRRKTTCIGQEFPDDSAKVDSNSQLHERLGRLETVVDRLVRKVDITDQPANGWTSHISSGRDLRGESCSSKTIPIVRDDRLSNLVGLHRHDSDVCASRCNPFNGIQSDTTLASSKRRSVDKAEDSTRAFAD